MGFSLGMVLDGVVLPGTQAVIRDPNAWWSWDLPADQPDLRLRRGAKIDVHGLHWTAGPSRMGERAAAKLVAAMKSRKRPNTNDPMDVSVHFCVSADGLIFQLADLRYATVHMGRSVNLRSVGTEHCWPGTEAQAHALGETCEVVERTVRGNRIRMAVPDPRMVAASLRLSRLLTDPEVQAATQGLLCVPRVTAKASIPSTGGAVEHWQYPGTTKVDCGGLLLDALRADGWR
jgi:hypothetical protein